MLLAIARHLLCKQDDEYDLDYFRRLNADAEEAVPCPRADIVAVAEKDKAADEQDVEYRQIHPLVRNKVRVNDREHEKRGNAQKHCKRLNKNVLCPARFARDTVYHHDAEERADSADDEQEHIRPFEKVFKFYRFDIYCPRRPSIMLYFTNYRLLMPNILAYYCPLRNEVSCGIIQIQKKFKNEVR